VVHCYVLTAIIIVYNSNEFIELIRVLRRQIDPGHGVNDHRNRVERADGKISVLRYRDADGEEDEQNAISTRTKVPTCVRWYGYVVRVAAVNDVVGFVEKFEYRYARHASTAIVFLVFDGVLSACGH